MADQLLVPRRISEWFTKDGNFTRQAFRFFEDLTSITNTTTEVIIDDIGEGSIINRALATSSAQIFNLKSQIEESNDRIEGNEIDLASRPRMPDIVKTNQRIEELIDELTEQLEKLNVGSEAQQQSVCLQVETLKQIKLLNIRTEEAFNTQINEDDL